MKNLLNHKAQSEAPSVKTIKKRQRKERRQVKRTVKTVGDKIQLVGKENEHYLTRNGDVMDILKVHGVSGVHRLTNEDRDHFIHQYAGGLRTLTQSLTFIVLDFLVNHQAQFDFYTYKYQQLTEATDPHGNKRYWLNKEIEALTQRQLHATEEQYFVFVFGEQPQQLQEHLAQLKRLSALKVETISPHEKEALLYQLHNLNSLPLNPVKKERESHV